MKNVVHWRQIEKDAKDRLAPDVTPQPATSIHGSLEGVDPAQFGALSPLAAGPSAPAAVLARLAKVGASRKAVEETLAVLAPTHGEKSIEELGAVVAGVNDAPIGGDIFAGGDPSDTDSVAAVPLLPAMLADQKAREAKYGTVSPGSGTSGAGVALAQPATALGHPRIFDASEGTRLDPLLNKTYDLNYGKVVPTMQ